jgi:hypothetical protein
MIIYIIICFLYGLYSIYVQRTVSKYKNNNSWKFCIFISFPINFIFFPISLIISIFNYKTYIIIYRRIKKNINKILK